MGIFLSVLLTILKVILIILLVVIGLVLLILAIVLFPPIHYKIEGTMDEEVLADIKARYLIVKFDGKYDKENGFIYYVKILGFIIKSNSEEFLKKQEEKERLKEEKERIKEEKRKKKKGEGGEQKTTSYDEFEGMDDEFDLYESYRGDAVVEGADTSDSSGSINQGEKADFLESDVDDEDYVSDESFAEGTSSKTESNSKGRPNKKAADNPLTKFYKKILDILNSIKEKVEKARTKVSHVEQFLDRPFTKRTIERTKKALYDIGIRIKPKKSSGHFRLGMKSPADTGMIVGYLSAVWPNYNRCITIEPDYHHSIMEGNICIKGWFNLGHIVFPVLYVVLRKVFKRTYQLFKKI